MKRLITLALFTITLFSCQDRHSPEPVTERQTGIHIENIYPYSDDNLIEALNKLGSENGRVSSSFGNINMDSVLKVLNYGSGITNYSILLESNLSDGLELYFDNLIISLTQDSSYAYVVRYVPEFSFIKSEQTLFNGSYTGEIILFDTNGDQLSKTYMTNGTVNKEHQENGRTDEYLKDCDGDIWCDYNNNLGETFCVYEIICMSGGESDEPTNDGPTGEDYDNWDGGDFDGGTEGDPMNDGNGGLSGGGSGSTSGNPATSSGNSNYTAVKNLSLEDAISKLADLWEQQNITLNQSFKDDPCLMEIWTAAMESNAAFQMLAGFLEEFPIAELELAVPNQTEFFNLGGLPNSDWAITKNWVQEIAIYLNANKLQQSSLMFTSAIIAHELIHAEMWRKLGSLPTNNGYINLEAYQHNFPGLYDYMAESDVGQHNAMASHYRPQIISFLRNLDIHINGTDENKNLYEPLSWIGLEGTNAWTQLTQNVKTVILNEQNNENTKGKCN